MNIYCFNCENSVPENASACPRCGHPLKATPEYISEKYIYAPNTSPLLMRIIRHPAVIIMLGVVVFASLAMYAKTESGTQTRSPQSVEKKTEPTIDAKTEPETQIQSPRTSSNKSAPTIDVNERHRAGVISLSSALQKKGYVDDNGNSISIFDRMMMGFNRTQGTVEYRWWITRHANCTLRVDRNSITDEGLGRVAKDEWRRYAHEFESEDFVSTGSEGVDDLINQWRAAGHSDDENGYFTAMRSNYDYDFEFTLTDYTSSYTDDYGEYHPESGTLSIKFELKSK